MFAIAAAGLAFYQLVIVNGASKEEGRRVGRLMAAADSLEMRFIGIPNWGARGLLEEQMWVAKEIGQRYAGFEPFDQRADKVRNLIVGRLGELEFEAFELEMLTQDSEGRSYKDWYFVSSVEMPVAFPGICFGSFKKWRSAKVVLEVPEFNREYPVRSEDAEFAYGLVHERMIEFLLKSKVPDLQVGGSRAVLVYAGRIDAEFVLASARFFEQFWQLVPDYMKEDWKA